MPIPVIGKISDHPTTVHSPSFVVDTDPGVDDALAMFVSLISVIRLQRNIISLLAIASKELDILSYIISYGELCSTLQLPSELTGNREHRSRLLLVYFLLARSFVASAYTTVASTFSRFTRPSSLTYNSFHPKHKIFPISIQRGSQF